MKSVLDTFFWGFFAVIALMIVFVRAGQYGGATGGAQTATILNGAGSAGSNLGKALNGG